MTADLNIIDTVVRRGTFTVFTHLVEGSLLKKKLRSDSARVVIKDIDATNGIIHGIDSLLMPRAVAATAI